MVLCGFLGCQNSESQENPEIPENHESLDPVAEVQPVEPAAANDGHDATVERLVQRRLELEKKLDPLHRAVAANPENPDARLTLGRALHEANLETEAVAEFEKAVQLQTDTRTLLALALGYSAAARLDEAAATYDRLLTLDPDFVIAIHNLGNLAHRRGQYAQAIDLYKRALSVDPEYGLAQLHLADSLLAAEQSREAYRAYEKVVTHDPQTPAELQTYIDALYGLGSLDLTMGAHQRAGQFLTEVIRLAPEHPAAYYSYGQLMLRLNRPENAQKAFDRHVQLLASREAAGPAAMGN